ncbi:hypothetical protein DVB37_16245 [Achromobacter sp. B7]|uniref:hypothetical protein n=1 Tax=Achromobacter sp. B7 TaxID=2282475 RepID=UPI000E73F7C3|nr:hypothetical protein [Achromobacter sp. B7]AYD65295.1 hypothetical protein DVB37_16245 [Achromobacter sp. B7]
MRFAYVDQEGRVVSAHNDDTVDAVPVGAVPLDEAQFEDRFSLKWDQTGWVRDEAAGAGGPSPARDIQVSRFQLFGALLELNELSAVLEWGEQEAEPLHKLALETSAVFSNSSAAICALATARGWDENYVVQLFQRAAQVRA